MLRSRTHTTAMATSAKRRKRARVLSPLALDPLLTRRKQNERPPPSASAHGAARSLNCSPHGERRAQGQASVSVGWNDVSTDDVSTVVVYTTFQRRGKWCLGSRSVGWRETVSRHLHSSLRRNESPPKFYTFLGISRGWKTSDKVFSWNLLGLSVRDSIDILGVFHALLG